MYHILLLLSFFLLISGCKPESVEFAPAEDTVLTPPPSSSGGGDEVPPIQPPVVEITQKPRNHFLGQSTRVSYKVIPGDFPIQDTECRVDGWPLPCLITSLWLELKGFGLGNHKFEVLAFDSEGLSDQESAQWSVSNQVQAVSQSVSVKPDGNRADILFVIDNSGSMAEEQREMARRISKFFPRIQQLDWRVGIITTDPFTVTSTAQPNPFGDGKLLPFPDRSYWLNSGINLGLAEDLFGRTIQRQEEGSGLERGIFSTYRAIKRSLFPNESIENLRLANFFRSDASLSVVLISDENETFYYDNGVALPEIEMSRPLNLLNYIDRVWGSQKKFQFNSVIVRPGDQSCLGQYELYGDIYAELSRYTNGVIEDICAPDYTGALRNIAAGVINLQRIYNLQCEPLDQNGDGQPDFKVVRSQGNASIPSYRLIGDQVEFSRPLSPGSYSFEYSCLSNVPN